MSHSHRYIRHIRKILFNNNKSFFFCKYHTRKNFIKNFVLYNIFKNHKNR